MAIFVPKGHLVLITNQQELLVFSFAEFNYVGEFRGTAPIVGMGVE